MSHDSMFLSKDELKELTGATHKRLIFAYLNKRRIRYDTNDKDEIKVLRQAVLDFLSPNPTGSSSTKRKPHPSKKLNF